MSANKTELVAFRLTPSDRRRLSAAAASASMSESAYIRAVLSGRGVTIVQIPIDGARLDALMRELKKSGTNLNQIARWVNRGGKPAPGELAAAMAAHRAVVDAVYDFIDETRPRCS